MTSRTLTDALSEVYLQISSNILESFPKFHPPVDLYVYEESLGQVRKFHKADSRLSQDKQASVAEYAGNGLLFLLRDDYRIYAHHLSRKLGLVLVEDDLKPLEVAEIFFLAFRDRMESFLEQPREEPLREIVKDVSILAEYLWTDPCRVEFLTKTLQKEYDPAVHAVNTMFIGLAVFTMASEGRLEHMELVSLALGLLVHDLGMVNVPRFITDKEQYLIRSDRESIERHIEAGLHKLSRLKIADPLVLQCVSQHHERIDGSGYPQRLKGEKIGMAGRLCAVADSFSALIGDRPYHDAKVLHEAAASLMKDTKRYDSKLTKLLVRLIREGFAHCSIQE